MSAPVGRPRLPPATCGACGKGFTSGGRRGVSALCPPCYARAWRAARRTTPPRRPGRLRVAADLAFAAAEAVQTLRAVTTTGASREELLARADSLAEALAKWSEVTTGREER